MCLRQVFRDIGSSIWNPPRGALDREALNGRLRAYWVRCQYIIWNALATGLLYTFNDSLPNIHLNQQQYYYNILFHSFQALSILFYFVTSFRNPGYITPIQSPHDSIHMDLKEALTNDKQAPIYTRNEQDYKYLDMNADFVITHIKTGDHASNDNKAPIVATFPYEIVEHIPDYNCDIMIDPNSAPSNFCWRCKFIRPIRSKHCYDCDRCVGKFDHHCPMVGNCVAGNNHRFFVLFLTSQTVVVLWAFYMSLNTLFEMNLIIGHSAKNHAGRRGGFGWLLRIALFVALFFAVFVTVGLSGYHCYLSLTNQTTYEMIKPQMVESYLKDELKRKKKFVKRHERRRMKRLKKDRETEKMRAKELNRQRIELQKQIDVLQDEKEEQKQPPCADGSSDDSEEDTVSSDDTSSSEKGLLFDQKQQQKQRAENKRGGTPKPKGRKRKLSTWSNYTDEYINYFDEGFAANLWIFVSGKMHPEWRTPLPCTVIKKRPTKNGK